jgi:uncharacterized protein (DUF1697 family)
MAEARLTRFVALLRAVNVGGTGKIRMADLAALCGALGFVDAATLLQSGNVVFAASGTAAAVAGKLAAGIAAAHGFRPEVIVRTAKEIDAAIALNPFRDEAAADPGHLLVGFTAAKPVAEAAARLATVKVARERLALAGRELYAWYPDGIGRSKVTNAVLEKALGVPVTARNWTTVAKIAEMLKRS